MQIDTLKEIGNIGIGNAATALSKMTSQKVDISLPSIEFLNFEKIFSDSDSIMMVVNSMIEGDLEGNVLVFFEKKKAFLILELIQKKPFGTIQDIDDMSQSAFMEMVNIIGGAYLDSLSQFTNYRLMPKPPEFYFDKLMTLKQQIIKDLPPNMNDIIEIKTQLNINNTQVDGNFYLLLPNVAMSKILSKII